MNRTADIQFKNNTLSVVFYDNEVPVGEIKYPDKSRYYVEDAAENWETGILNTDIIKKYGTYYES